MPIQQLYKNIFDITDSNTQDPAMLKQVVKKYPYFSLAHFFLLKQTAPNDDNFESICAKTALHFNNVFLLNEKLNDNKTEATKVLNTNTEPGLQDIIPIEILEQIEIIEPVLIEEAPAPVVEKQTDSILKNQNDEQKQIVQEDEPLLFQPLFATDYFASQGIKLNQDALPNDKLGKQLKSFTDWLKTMKKVHDSKLPEESEKMDITVQTLAEKSNKEQDVITETMAEVFLQQGKRHKAKEIYEKLSLLNPSKSAYFAAKLEQFK